MKKGFISLHTALVTDLTAYQLQHDHSVNVSEKLFSQQDAGHMWSFTDILYYPNHHYVTSITIYKQYIVSMPTFFSYLYIIYFSKCWHRLNEPLITMNSIRSVLNLFPAKEELFDFNFQIACQENFKMPKE